MAAEQVAPRRPSYRRTSREMRQGAEQRHSVVSVSLAYVRRSPDAPWHVTSWRGDYLRVMRHDALGDARDTFAAEVRRARAEEVR